MVTKGVACHPSDWKDSHFSLADLEKRGGFHTFQFMRKTVIILTICIVAVPSMACRMWLVMPVDQTVFYDADADTLNAFVQGQLEQMELLGGFTGGAYANRNGWAWVSYRNELGRAVPDWQRSAEAAYEDSSYRQSSAEALRSENLTFYLGHVRNASSGARAIPNPHPFMFTTQDGRIWAFGHNGDMNKEYLRDLLGEAWLGRYPPQTYGTGPWNGSGWTNVVDSELMFLWLMKCVETYDDELLALSVALDSLEIRYPGYAKNFVLTDGSNAWIYRSSTTQDIWYYDGTGPAEAPYTGFPTGHRAVMSTPPATGPARALSWQALDDDALLVFDDDGEVTLHENLTGIHREGDHIKPGESFRILGNFPNPFNERTRLDFLIESDDAIQSLEVFDIQGRRVSSLHSDQSTWWNLQTIFWDGRDQHGYSLPSGVYLYRLSTLKHRVTGRMVLMR